MLFPKLLAEPVHVEISHGSDPLAPALSNINPEKVSLIQPRHLFKIRRIKRNLFAQSIHYDGCGKPALIDVQLFQEGHIFLNIHIVLVQ